MTVDSLVLLTPLLLVPIVLLFVFVGCGLDSEYEVPPAQFTDVEIAYGFELAARVVSFSATVTVLDAKKQQLKYPGTAATTGANAIDPDGGGLLVLVPYTSFAKTDSTGWLTCACKVTAKLATSDPVDVGPLELPLGNFPYPDFELQVFVEPETGATKFSLAQKTKSS